MKRGAAVAALLGLLLLTGIVVWQGVGEVSRALAVAGWALALLAPYYVLVLLADGIGWWVLFPPSCRPPPRRAVALRWISSAVNQLLPAAQVGGEVVRARLLIRRGIPAGLAGATVVAALTAAAATLGVFGLLGVGLLVGRLERPNFLPGLTLGLAVLLGLIAVFFALQRRGLFSLLARWAMRLTGGERGGLAVGAEELDEALRNTYRRPARFAASLGLHLLGLFVGTGEVWIALHLLGSPVPLGDALLLESLVQAVRGVAFLVPGAWGVQEGVFVALGGVVGLGPTVSLAVSLAKRARELMVGLPALLVWQAAEGVGVARWLGAGTEGS